MGIEIFDPLIVAAAEKYHLDAQVIRAVILTESLGDPWSYRYESSYRYLVSPRAYADHLAISFDSEVAFQRTSIGLMHPMGGVCREHGFMDKLSQIFQPELSIEYGCKHLQLKAQKYGTDPATLYAAYNAGSPEKTPGGMFTNQTNVDRFSQYLLKLEALE